MNDNDNDDAERGQACMWITFALKAWTDENLNKWTNE